METTCTVWPALRERRPGGGGDLLMCNSCRRAALVLPLRFAPEGAEADDSEEQMPVRRSGCGGAERRHQWWWRREQHDAVRRWAGCDSQRGLVMVISNTQDSGGLAGTDRHLTLDLLGIWENCHPRRGGGLRIGERELQTLA